MRYCPGGKIQSGVVDLAFNPLKPLLACVLENGIICSFSSDSYSSPFADWNGSILNCKVHLPAAISWNVLNLPFL